MAREFVFHPLQVVTEMPNGSLLVGFTASGWVEMAWHLVSWGNAVEVLEPPQLIDILEQVRRAEIKVLPGSVQQRAENGRSHRNTRMFGLRRELPKQSCEPCSPF